MGKPLDPEYNRKYYLRHRESLITASAANYAANKDNAEFKAKRKKYRELRHFGVDREAILAKSNGLCVRCGKPAQVIHHLDHDGRNLEKLGALPGRDPMRMEALCRACHINEHRDTLHANRMAKIASSWSRNHEACIVCGTTDRRHQGKGYCVNCAARSYKIRKRESGACSL